MVTIVVARYNETLEWLDEYPFNQFRYVVYNKGPNQRFARAHVDQVVELPNVGRCDHTYMHHIVHNYATLSGILVFFPGSLDIFFKKEKASMVLRYILATKRAAVPIACRCDVRATFGDFTLDTWACIHSGNAELNPESALTPARLRPFGRWYDAHFGAVRGDFFAIHGIFSVSAQDVTQHKVGRYVSLLQELGQSSNPEVGHYMERAWSAVFYPLRNTDKLVLK